MQREAISKLLEQVPGRATLVRATPQVMLFTYKLLGAYYVVDLEAGTVTKQYEVAYAA